MKTYYATITRSVLSLRMMLTLSKRGILGQVLFSAVLVAAATELATPTCAAPPATAVSASLQGHIVLVTGARFRAGSMVNLTLVRIASSTENTSLAVLAKRSARAQYATVGCPDIAMIPGCTVPNPRAGTISVRMYLKQRHQASDLAVLYHSPGHNGLEEVTAK